MLDREVISVTLRDIAPERPRTDQESQLLMQVRPL